MIRRAAALAVVLAWTALPALAQGIGTVEEVRATAYRTPPAGGRQPVSLRAGVVQNERIETLADSAVGMRFLDDTSFRVGPESSVVLDTYVYDPRSSQGQLAIGIARGSMRFVTGKLSKGGVQIVTPTATIGVRGTDFAVIVYPGGVTDVLVFDGSVVMQPLQLQQLTVLAVGQYGRIQNANSPGQVYGPPPSSRGGFIGINSVDEKIEGFQPLPAGAPPTPFFNPVPAVPVQPQHTMPSTPPPSPTFPPSNSIGGPFR